MSESEPRGRLLHDAVAPYAASDAPPAFVKLSVSLPADLVEVVRAAAAASGLSVSATIAAALRRTIADADQARLDAALEADREENVAWATADESVVGKLVSELKW